MVISIETLFAVWQWTNVGLCLLPLWFFLLFLCISNWVIFHKRPIKITNSSNLSYFSYHFVELFFYIRKCKERSEHVNNATDLRQIKHIQLQYLVNHSPPGLTFDRSHIFGPCSVSSFIILNDSRRTIVLEWFRFCERPKFKSFEYNPVNITCFE